MGAGGVGCMGGRSLEECCEAMGAKCRLRQRQYYCSVPCPCCNKEKRRHERENLAIQATITENKLILLAQTRLRSRVGGQDDTKKSFPGITATFFSLRWQ